MVADIAARMLKVVTDDMRAELIHEPVAALHRRFGLRVQPFEGFRGDDCSCDGMYDANLVPGQAIVFYDPTPSRERQLFTLLHELGHHIIASVDPDLYDMIDMAATRSEELEHIEESACHTFAGEILLPGPVVESQLAEAGPTPATLVALKDLGAASWEATLVQVARHQTGRTALVMMRHHDRVGFVASNGRMGWPRNSRVRPTGPLSRSLSSANLTAREDVYRWGLPFEETMFADTTRIGSNLALGVMTLVPTRGLSILEDRPPSWANRTHYCPQCSEIMTVGWCDRCKGRRCRHCDVCLCSGAATDQRLCEACFQTKSVSVFDGASNRCRDCD